MRNTIALLDRARKLCIPPTDYQLAKRLEVTPQRLSNWRRQSSVPDNQVAFRLAKLLEMPTTDVIAYFEEDKAKDDKTREFWRCQLPRLLPSIAIAVTATLAGQGGTLIDGLRDGTTAVPFNLSTQLAIHYAQYVYRP